MRNISTEKNFLTKIGIKKGAGCGFISWFVLGFILFIFVIFAYRFGVYFRHINNGDIIELPRNLARLTVTDGEALSYSSDLNADLDDLIDQPRLGVSPEDAVVTVVLFGDYECPFSKEASTIIRRLAVKYPDNVSFVYRDYPLSSIHPNTYLASLAAECAKEQQKFWEYFDQLYVNSPAVSGDDLIKYAENAGLEMNQFNSCVTEKRYERKISEDLAAAQALGLRGTPVYIINGGIIEGSVTEAELDLIIQKILNRR